MKKFSVKVTSASNGVDRLEISASNAKEALKKVSGCLVDPEWRSLEYQLPDDAFHVDIVEVPQADKR